MTPSAEFTSRDRYWMRRALHLAGKGYTTPNPAVGCVIVKDDILIGDGYHPAAGQPHAEVFALRQAGSNARGSTVYVTLEPCSHYGRTPPCASALIEAGVARVTAAVQDPNPLVSGKGFLMLQNAGIDVQAGLLAEEAIRINRGFFHFQKTGMPFVTLKCAMTLDGKIATHTGDSCWISSDASRKLVHELRAKSSAVLCGIGTALKDDPLLNARPESKFPRQPLRILLDSKLRLPESSRLVQTADQFPILIVVTQPQSAEKQRRFEKRGIEILSISADTMGRISLPALMTELGKRGIVQLLVEGGGEVHASFLEEQCAHNLLWFVAPLLLGGKDAPTPMGGVGKDKVADAIAVDHLSCRSVGADFLFEGSPVYR